MRFLAVHLNGLDRFWAKRSLDELDDEKLSIDPAAGSWLVHWNENHRDGAQIGGRETRAWSKFHE